jgi:hypothetical protein
LYKCFRRFLWNAASRKDVNKAPIIKFKRSRTQNGADLWASDTAHAKLINNEITAERVSRNLPTTANVGLRSSIKARLFNALTDGEREEWDNKAKQQAESKQNATEEEQVVECVSTISLCIL